LLKQLPSSGCLPGLIPMQSRRETTMNPDSAHKSRWEISEVVFGIPFLLSLALQWMVPLSLPQGILRQALIPTGAVLFSAGIALAVLARRELARYGQSTEPGHPTSQIVMTGVFSISRNPLYLGVVSMLAGIGLALNFLWILVLLIAGIGLCQSVLIGPEERYLQNKFGKEYLAYAAAVRRWLGRR
jgi:protein-S-isoprenylcysteine O-methyltransferase Ste14